MSVSSSASSVKSIVFDEDATGFGMANVSLGSVFIAGLIGISSSSSLSITTSCNQIDIKMTNKTGGKEKFSKKVTYANLSHYSTWKLLVTHSILFREIKGSF